MKPAVIIDLNSGNLLSLENALNRDGQAVCRIQKPSAYDFRGDEILVLPGQGRFAFISERMDVLGWRSFLSDWLNQGGHLVGICVGMQILFEGSDEDPEAPGLGYFSGRCQHLKHPKTPMVGWAKLDSYKLNMKDQYAYFVNSYGVPDCDASTAKVTYGQPFCAAVQKGRVYGFQFHPEKSGRFGRELLQHVCQ
ncbi:imidazole glycerol phosphate synthase subunit HisH [Marinicella gelatinilytica]|uniref:imidazole glycerol phosphate synthase subunit HisH n=1 Tax=Marinicella gelatinilytica TaxID=2996017 RepID=UPI002260CB52|nr:imidazole glycerol phosphate synthase subunit HisH [Marinicella gelatinilytica]MCX7544230.1 imidazole glycerol phosphate synthase subunit HisH [Marinicella gelatinilytica]